MRDLHETKYSFKDLLVRVFCLQASQVIRVNLANKVACDRADPCGKFDFRKNNFQVSENLLYRTLVN